MRDFKAVYTIIAVLMYLKYMHYGCWHHQANSLRTIFKVDALASQTISGRKTAN